MFKKAVLSFFDRTKISGRKVVYWQGKKSRHYDSKSFVDMKTNLVWIVRICCIYFQQPFSILKILIGQQRRKIKRDQI